MRNTFIILLSLLFLLSFTGCMTYAKISNKCWIKAVEYSEWMEEPECKNYATTDYYCGCMEANNLNPWTYKKIKK